MFGLKLIENVWSDLHRLWTVRVALAYAVFAGVAMVISAFADVFNPWLLLGISVFVSVGIVVLRLVKQKDPMEPIA